MKSRRTRLGVWFLWTAVLSRTAMGAEPTTLSPTDQTRFEELKSRKLQQFQGHAELAEYMDLRKRALGNLPSPAEDIAHYAMMRLGEPYRRGAWSQDLAASDCVSLTEFCVSRACADSWQTAHRLLNRLRFKNGTGRTADLNREPILDWIPSNSWLFDDITTELGAQTVSFNVESDGRTGAATYVPKELIPDVFKQLRTGDLMFVIADSANPPSDPVMRTRCVHMAIIHKPAGADQVRILHSYPPVVSSWKIERLLRNPHLRGAKFLRLKPDARQVVLGEFGTAPSRMKDTPVSLDNKALVRKGRPAFVTPTRPPDEIVEIDGIRYGVLQIRPDETLWGLLKEGWKSVYNTSINQEFKSRYSDLRTAPYKGDRIYVPLSRVDGSLTPIEADPVSRN